MSEQMFQLEQDEELRIEVDCAKGEKVTVELMSGIAEIFGTEMVTNTKYKFGSGTKLAVFTYQGCSIKVREATHYHYVLHRRSSEACRIYTETCA